MRQQDNVTFLSYSGHFFRDFVELFGLFPELHVLVDLVWALTDDF